MAPRPRCFAFPTRLPMLLMGLTMLLLHGCAELDTGLKKAVVMKYAHVANVRSFQATVNGTQRQLVGTNPGSVWAIFDICSIDVQGNTLTGLNYSADKFIADAGSASYGAGTPGTINVASVPMPSNSADVDSALRDAFKLGPASQVLPKQFYPNLNYRVAIFVRDNPPGYTGGVMALRYDGAPQVAAVVQSVSSNNPAMRDFYLSGASPPIASACP